MVWTLTKTLNIIRLSQGCPILTSWYVMEGDVKVTLNNIPKMCNLVFMYEEL